MIVSDSGPIIAFARIRRLELLREIVGSLLIPDAAYEEVAVRGRGMPGATDVQQASWIRKQPIADRALVKLLPSALHQGEREAIVLAEEVKAQLLIDEERGRRVSRERGIIVIGTLRLLAEAKQQGLLDRVEPVCNTMRAAGYRIEEKLLESFLEALGERGRDP